MFKAFSGSLIRCLLLSDVFYAMAVKLSKNIRLYLQMALNLIKRRKPGKVCKHGLYRKTRNNYRNRDLC